ncbi:MAG: DJ-1/PfpI/YhbO family deglycase/protease [Planctomycetota bacterium]
MSTVLILVAEGFEDSELTVPVERLAEAGHRVVYAGAAVGSIQGKRGEALVHVGQTSDELEVEDYDALLIPGGRSPERLCRHRPSVELAQRFALTGKPVAAICHGPLLLLAAGMVRGRVLTSYGEDDVPESLRQGGADWRDQDVVVDRNLVTSRTPADLDAFCRELLGLLGSLTTVGHLKVLVQEDEYVELLAKGKLTRAHYDAVVPRLEAQLETAGRLRALIRLEGFRGWAASGIAAELRFDLRHRKDFDRIAVVGEGKLQEWGTKLSRPFFGGEVRYFEQIAAARAWIAERAKVAPTAR